MKGVQQANTIGAAADGDDDRRGHAGGRGEELVAFLRSRQVRQQRVWLALRGIQDHAAIISPWTCTPGIAGVADAYGLPTGIWVALMCVVYSRLIFLWFGCGDFTDTCSGGRLYSDCQGA